MWNGAAEILNATEHEIFQTGFGRAGRVAAERRQDIKRQGLQLQSDIKRDQIVRGDHHRHAEHGKQDQHRKLEQHHLRAHHILARQHQNDRRTEEHKYLRKARHTIRDKDAAKGRFGIARLRVGKGTGDHQNRDREPQDHDRCGLALRENADHQQHDRACGKDQFGTGDEKIECFHVSRAPSGCWRERQRPRLRQSQSTPACRPPRSNYPANSQPTG